MIYIIMVGTDKSVRGGISTVVEQYLESDRWEDSKIHYIPTFIEAPSIFKVFFFMVAFIKIFF